MPAASFNLTHVTPRRRQPPWRRLIIPAVMASFEGFRSKTLLPQFALLLNPSSFSRSCTQLAHTVVCAHGGLEMEGVSC
jgi:hypothetical protein